MPLSMYRASAPVLVTALNGLGVILDKGAAFAEAKKIDPSVLINARLYPDMLPLSRQVHIATDVGRRGMARLAGTEPLSIADDETTFEQLKARVSKSIEYIESFPPEQIDGSEERRITVPMGDEQKTFACVDYLFRFVLPNVFFHVTTTYAILRHSGVELGKRDFLGEI
ncbi:MAG TPA: DUF1993 domain-containing protein [Rhizomicrobium sp.]|jgi:hypothetical protein